MRFKNLRESIQGWNDLTSIDHADYAIHLRDGFFAFAEFDFLTISAGADGIFID